VVFAQSTSPAPATPPAAAATPALTFDVASVKPAAPLDQAKLQADIKEGKMPKFGQQLDGARAEYHFTSLKELIVYAYKVKPYQISGPAWLNTERFDIMAKLPDGATKADVPKMLQALLAERFKLAVHRDSKEQPVLALVVSKGGPKLKESAGVPVAIDESAPLKPGEMKIDGPDGQIRMTVDPKNGSMVMNMGIKGTMHQKMDMATRNIHLDADMINMAGFAEMMTQMMQIGGGGGRQVVDMTDLKGYYQVAIDISLEEIMKMSRAAGGDMGGAPAPDTSARPADAASDPGGMSVTDTVQTLGLKLTPRKAVLEQLIVDHAEKTPTEN
jgi:uncharacterized protein (TIGR03435 family)